MIYLPDVNVWIALASDRHIHHKVARDWFQRFEEGEIAFCRITEIGSLRLLTNRHVMGVDTVTSKGAWQVYDALRRDQRVIFLDETTEFAALWRQRSEVAIGGPNMWTDAYLLAFAAVYKAKIVTFDRALGARAESEVLRIG
jgi:toxin-antitoxin system PIN domain toxin